VVEDNPVNQKVAAAMLRALGHAVDLAENGQDAVEKLAVGCYDLVFMDMQMPVLDGLAATRVIRAREGQGARVPIIAMTASAMAEEREACLAAGMDEHLAKPVRLQQVREVIARFAPHAIVS
jgi:CheY-like chemotaxis protein